MTTAGILAFLCPGGIPLCSTITETEQSYTSTVVAAMFANDVDVNYVTIIAAGCWP